MCKSYSAEVWLCMTSLYYCVHVIHILCSLEKDQRKGHYDELVENNLKVIIFHKNELDLTNKNKQYLSSDFQVCSSLYVTC